MAFPANHKTVFVLDHSPYFSMPCDQVEFDFQKSRPTGYIPLAPINKSMWTCATEAVMEYCRIVWDLFPQEKLLRFVVSDQEPKQIASWDTEEQDSTVLTNGLAQCGRPEPESRKKTAAAKGYSITNGLEMALRSLCEVTAQQRQVRAKMAEGGLPRLVNRGRIVCITHLLDDRHLHHIIASFQDLVSAVNKDAAASDNLVPIGLVDLVVVHCFPRNMECTISSVPTALELSPLITYQVFPVDAGEGLAKKLLHMVLCHYNLASTTVTGIPMKEEQNASSSANYDVELFHSAASHDRLFSHRESNQTMREGCEYQTITLKWCTPRGSTADLHHCTGTVRVTPTDVNSRPSSCLTNFLLSGRSVMLEMPRRSGSKTLSHMLTSHGGEIFIHTLSISRSILEDPPSISEGAGGRVTDYRITDLAELMKANRLAPFMGTGDGPSISAKERLNRFTKCCPMTISSTTIFNMAAVEPLQKIMVEEELSEDDLSEAKKVIYGLLAMESKGEALPVPVQTSTAGKSKAMKKDDQYRMMFNELEKFLGAHCRTDRHTKVLDCLLECRNKPQSDRPSKKDDKVELDVALRELDKYNTLTEREKSDFNLSQDGVLRSTTESPMSPTSGGPSSAKRARTSEFGSGKSLLDIWTNKLQREQTKNHVPFAGLRGVGEKAKLYLNLERPKTDPTGMGEM